MKKGLEITFQLSSSGESSSVVSALGNLTGNYASAEFGADWMMFHVTLGRNHFYKLLFSGPVGDLHPLNRKKVQEKFDSLQHLSLDELMKTYREEERKPGFRVKEIRELKEEYDLWEDRFWTYF
ncbi:MAG: hypothetical protein J9259_02515 [Thermoplasmata archaeon YP2-bin.285]|uniref:DUF2004 domain-containing protein n=1 Tax=Candidatus Sysuiplasma superficiale TaxID=2823368 RepID=A0A8J7YJI6_9ARCH|nr:hypothetical protein [Candidatus Sysuiplasma superficiale]